MLKRLEGGPLPPKAAFVGLQGKADRNSFTSDIHTFRSHSRPIRAVPVNLIKMLKFLIETGTSAAQRVRQVL